MKHSCKAMNDMIKIIKNDYKCKVEIKKKGTILIFPPDGKKVYTFHIGERGFHPLRRFIKTLS